MITYEQLRAIINTMSEEELKKEVVVRHNSMDEYHYLMDEYPFLTADALDPCLDEGHPFLLI